MIAEKKNLNSSDGWLSKLRKSVRTEKKKIPKDKQNIKDSD